MAKKAKTIVVFRKDKGTDGAVFALFPHIPTDVECKYCSTYQHVGQHSAADYHACMDRSRPAKPAEFAALKAELEGRGYVLDIRQKVNRDAMMEARRVELHKILHS